MLSLSLSFDDELPLAVVIRIAAAETTDKEEADNFKLTMFLALFMKRDQVDYAWKVKQSKEPNIAMDIFISKCGYGGARHAMFQLRRRQSPAERERVDFAASCLFSVQLLPPSIVPSSRELLTENLIEN